MYAPRCGNTPGYNTGSSFAGSGCSTPSAYSLSSVGGPVVPVVLVLHGDEDLVEQRVAELDHRSELERVRDVDVAVVVVVVVDVDLIANVVAELVEVRPARRSLELHLLHCRGHAGGGRNGRRAREENFRRDVGSMVSPLRAGPRVPSDGTAWTTSSGVISGAVTQTAAVATRRSHTPRLALIACIGLPLVVLAIGAWHYRWMSDDGFINLRVVRQIEAGHGPVFNRGERVEAATSPLWVAVLTVADVLLPLRLEWIAVLLGIACTLGGIALVLYGTRFLVRLPTDEVPIPTGIWVLVAIAPTWKFASSGLENGLFTLWFGVSFALLARWAATDDTIPGWPTAVVLGLGPLIRPDVAFFSAALLVAVIVVATEQRVRFVATALALPVAYEIFRMGYYDELTPNTALAKEATRSWWSNGWHYLRVAGQPYWVWLPLITLAIGAYVPLWRDADRRRRAIVAGCVFAGGLHLLFVARVGGDFMHARLALPGLTALIAPVAVTPVSRSITRLVVPAIVIGWALVSITFLRSADDAPITFIGSPRNAITLADYGWQRDGPNRRWFTGSGVYFGETPVDAPARAGLPHGAVASFGVGIGSYALGTDVYVLDMLGLGDTFTAHLRLEHRGVVAHEKPLPKPWVAARLLDPNASVSEGQLPTPPLFIARPLDHPVGTFQDRVDAARQALECGRLRALLRRADAPLTFGRFVGNVFHSFSDTRLRIAPEPADAVKQFCGR